MYQYSLPWFTALFCKGIGEAPPANDIDARCRSIIGYYTYMLYCNVCRSLFEAHKLMFSFLLCIKILQGNDQVRTNPPAPAPCNGVGGRGKMKECGTSSALLSTVLCLRPERNG